MKKKLLLFSGILLAYLLLIALFYPGLFVKFSSRVPFGSAGDQQFILSIVDVSIHSSLQDLYNFPMFYPQSGALARTHPLFGISLFYKVFHWLGLNLEQSTNLYIIMGLLLGAMGCFLLAREVSGSTLFSFAFSILYIVHRKNVVHFAWLNFFSRFWLPFILYFLIRFFRTGRQRHLAAAAALSFLEFFTCIYLGTALGVFLLPAFVLFAWALRLVDWRGLLKTAAWFLLALGLIVAVFLPYLRPSLSVDLPTPDKGVTPADLFQFSHWLGPWLGRGSPVRSEALFPGLVVTAFFVLFFVPVHRRRRGLFFLLLFIPVPVLSVLAFSPGPLMEALFLLWAVLLVSALAMEWPELSTVERVVALSFFFFVLVNLKFSFLPGLKSLTAYGIFYKLLPPIHGLRQIHRAFLLVLPLPAALAAAGAARHFRRSGNRLVLRLAAAGLLVLITADNIDLSAALHPSRIMQPVPHPDTEVYGRLPFRSDLVVLEIPHYFRRPARNAEYLLNWRFHQNYLLNGRAWLRPVAYLRNLSQIIGKFQTDFPSDAQLEQLLQDYSVERVIIHWRLLRMYQRKSFDRRSMRANVRRLRDYGRVVAADSETVLIEVREFVPVTSIIRTISAFHLRRQPLYVRLKSPPDPPISIRLNGKDMPPDSALVSGNELLLDLRHQKLEPAGNRVEIRFSRPLAVSEVRLWPKNTPLPFGVR